MTGPEPDPSVSPFPWPPQPDESVLDAWARTWRGASLTPRTFFASMPRVRSPVAAVAYYLSVGIAVAGVQLFWTMVRGVGMWGTDADVLSAQAPWNPLVEFLVSPLILLLSLFITAGVTHLLLKLFGGVADDGGYGMTTRVFAYSYSPQILGIVPVAGTIAGFIWMVIIAITGIRETHRTTTASAAAAVLIPLAVGLVFVVMVELIVRAGGLLDTTM